MSKQSEKAETRLTDKQELFVRYYLISLNATDAARKAGYQGDYSTLRVVGHENLTKPNIKERVSAALKERAMPPEEILARLSRMASGTFEPFLYSGEVIKGEAPKLDLSTESARANIDLVKKVKTKTMTKIVEDSATEFVETEVELHDAQAALEKLGRYHKMFTDKTEISGEVKVVTAKELTDDELANIIATD